MFTGIEPTVPQLSPYFCFMKSHMNDRRKIQQLTKTMEDDEEVFYQNENYAFSFPINK